MSLRVKVIVFVQDFDQTMTGQSSVHGIIEEDNEEVMRESFQVYAEQAFACAVRMSRAAALIETEQGIHQTKALFKGPEGEQ